MSFKIADGYVEVHARHDRASTRRNAKEAADIAEDEGRNREGSMLRWLFKSNPSLHGMLAQPIAGIFGHPIIFAAAATMAVSVGGLLATGITTALLTGLTLGFVGIAAAVNKKALEVPWNNMTERVKGVFKRASQPIVQPMINAIGMVSAAFERMEPSLKRIYTAIAPLIEPFTGGILGMIEAMLPGIERAMPGIQQAILALAPHLPGLGTAMGDFFATLAENGPLLERVVGLMITWLENFFKVAGPIIVLMMMQFADMADAWNVLTTAVNAATEWIGDVWEKIPGWWNDSWGKVKEWFGDLKDTITGFFSETGTKISTWWDEQTGQISGWWDSTWGSISRWFEELPGKIGGFLSTLPGTIMGWFQQAFDTVLYGIGYWLGTVVGMILGLPTDLGNGLATAWTTVSTWFLGAIGWLTQQWTDFQAWLVLTVSSLPGEIGAFFQDMLGRAILAVSNGFHEIQDWWDRLPGMLYNIAHNAWNDVYDAFADGGDDVMDFFTGLRDRIVTTLANLAVDMWNVGGDIIKGLVNGIKDYLGWAIGQAWDAAIQIKNGFLDALNIGSPSKVMRDEVGQWIPKGIAVGIKDNMGELDDIAMGLPNMFTGNRPMGGSTSTDNSTTYGSITLEVHVDNLQELADIQAFLDGQLRNSTKANTWAGNIYEAQGEYVRSYS